MPPYELDDKNRFIICNYQHQNPFSSTLPGIAGQMGIPIWVFYVNRGQGIASFGTENKDHPIMEFQPANKAYQSTSTLGFRTFIKVHGDHKPVIYEPFAIYGENHEQKMIISLNELKITEESFLHGLQVDVVYFVLPNEKLSGLVRQLRIKNVSGKALDLEILDGLPVVIPYGVSNYDLKEYHRTIEAWMEVCNLETSIPFFRVRSLPVDQAEVKSFDSGNFAYALAVQNGNHQQLPVIVNPEILFGQDSSFRFPGLFETHSLSELNRLSYYPNGKTPCAFFGHPARLEDNQEIMLYSLYGNARHLDLVNEITPDLGSESFFIRKRQEANALIEDLIDPIRTKTAKPQFDAYCQQTFLDNNLRGGWPFELGDPGKRVIFHMYSRKHGDPERDYNAFYLAAEFYSQGNGNFRDICQNRRSEVWFAPFVGSKNIKSFTSLIQTDGYNPLTVKGSKFYLTKAQQSDLLVYTDDVGALASLLKEPFTPGGLLKKIADQEINLKVSPEVFIDHVLSHSEQFCDADYGEGYWTDHWIYILDLVLDYLSIFPEQRENVLFGNKEIPFYESPIFVQPRRKKYVLANGQPHQFGAVVPDKEKARLIKERSVMPNFVRTKYGQGEIFRTRLFSKLLILSIVKFSTLDPMGMGIEMEADKPSWCDALNGLPGLFGSSMAETYDLVRLFKFLQNNLLEDRGLHLELPVEVFELLQEILGALKTYSEDSSLNRDFSYWDQVASARENYRETTRLGLNGSETTIPLAEIAKLIDQMLDKLQSGIDRALKTSGGFPPTYFTYEADDFEYLLDDEGQELKDDDGRPLVRVLHFRQKTLPIFLEGSVRYLKITGDRQHAREIYKKVKESSLFDQKLKMYKTNVSLENESMDIGRLRAFTPGWLENESVFLHMEYKYLLEILKAGLYDEFFGDMQNALIAFQDPARYRRSPLENSSFLVSSAHPDDKLHGAGFVARLTGATAEFLSMYKITMMGHYPFTLQDDQLQLNFQPKLPGWIFDEDGRLSFTFLGKCKVTYINPARMNTYDQNARIQKIKLHLEGDVVEIDANVIGEPYASMIRDGLVEKIEVYFSED